MVEASVRDDRCTCVSLASERSVIGALNRSSLRDAIMEDCSDCYFNRNPSIVFDLFLLALRLWFEEEGERRNGVRAGWVCAYWRDRGGFLGRVLGCVGMVG